MVHLIDPHQHTRRCWWDHTHAHWVCDHQRELTVQDPVDVRDMLVVHTALLREYRLAPRLIRATAAGDLPRARTVTAHLTFLGDLLHHHHTGEDALLWPKLLTRVPAQLAPVVQLMQDQHHQIDALLTRVQQMLPDWSARAGTSTRDGLADTVEALHTALVEHLDNEESQVLPLAAACLTPAEWHAIGEAAVAVLPKRKLPLVFGMFMYEGDPTVLKAMLDTAPRLPRLLMPRIAPRSYARYARTLHGTPTP